MIAESGIVSESFEREAFLDLLAMVGVSHSKAGQDLQNSTRGEKAVMHILFAKEPQTPSELAESLHVTPGRISTALAGLQKKGWIVRVPDERDRRSASIKLSESGRAWLTEQYSRMAERICWIFTQMGKRRTDQFLSLVNEFLAYFSVLGPDQSFPPSSGQIEYEFEQRDERLAAMLEAVRSQNIL